MFVFKVYLIGAIGNSRTAKTEALQGLAFPKNHKKILAFKKLFSNYKILFKIILLIISLL
ncbi:hypothetical protein SAMN04488511_109213 [Pedobacter suwonensis]|uniref:Uncharacterized protein n=1 Tax=Pedobacter suwonensis TaxID=332999 RepID=A0A1I0TGK9_9SPHI|nr:hypothetical protein SAMN04488511_109213 [Pedobacter suwonensis]